MNNKSERSRKSIAIALVTVLALSPFYVAPKTTLNLLGLVGAPPAHALVPTAPNPKANETKPSAETGEAISAQCAACHGNNGISVGASIPDLAGQHYVYLLKQIEAFRDGVRKSPIMEEMVKTLSDVQMRDLAAYFASVPIKTASVKK